MTAATDSRMLQEDIAALIRDAVVSPYHQPSKEDALDLAQQITTMVRERVLREIESYARENIR
jgi:hypothetical protein